ncbi:septum formation family protein [Micromonospora rhizosphaerae]|uniref:septum formation family protein n=1 Tax=Micromonospora rhizosphaerae TaxID=568872 RepID=UPI00114CA716|nr:septum formation family protein [Micromonospora rhizosphaerae]
MSPRRVGALLMVLAASVVAGCDVLPGRDCESGFVPQAGVCHLAPGDNASGEAYQPVDCLTRHEAETFFVGRFAGLDADSDDPPETGSDAARRAYASCGTAARDFLGDEWRAARLSLQVMLPTATGWAAAERWYRCDLVEIVALDLYEPSPRANSLKGGLRSPSSPLRHGCYNPTFIGDEMKTLPPASCTGPHQSEFAGVWWADDFPYGEEIPEDDMWDGCYGVVARHVGVPDEDEVERRLDVLAWALSEEERAAGETGVLCFLHTDGPPFNRPLAGVGVKGLPAPQAD